MPAIFSTSRNTQTVLIHIGLVLIPSFPVKIVLDFYVQHTNRDWNYNNSPNTVAEFNSHPAVNKKGTVQNTQVQIRSLHGKRVLCKFDQLSSSKLHYLKSYFFSCLLKSRQYHFPLCNVLGCRLLQDIAINKKCISSLMRGDSLRALLFSLFKVWVKRLQKQVVKDSNSTSRSVAGACL